MEYPFTHMRYATNACQNSGSADDIYSMETIDPIAELSRAVKAAGSQRKWAAEHGLSAPYVSDVLAGRRDPGAAVLSALGLERVVSYRRIGQAPLAPDREQRLVSLMGAARKGEAKLRRGTAEQRG